MWTTTLGLGFGLCLLGMGTASAPWDEFIAFQDRFARRYSSLEEVQHRFSVFKTNLAAIWEHNARADAGGNSSSSIGFRLGVNLFSDLTPEEFKARISNPLLAPSSVEFEFVNVNRSKNGLRGSGSGSDSGAEGRVVEVGSYGCGVYSNNGAGGLPASVDWRKRGAVTSVKDQGQCGSCWAFSSTGAVEGAWALAGNTLQDLSEQQLVDCASGLAYGSRGCSGGQMEGGFKYISKNGQCALAAYPYVSGTTQTEGNCAAAQCKAVAHVKSCFDVEPMNSLALQAAVAQQPVAVAIEADTRYFQSYSSGVLDAETCGTNLDHGVLVVGYGTDENGKDYWLVKNSWSAAWGEDGYVKIARSTSSKKEAGICGIAMQPSFPVV